MAKATKPVSDTKRPTIRASVKAQYEAAKEQVLALDEKIDDLVDQRNSLELLVEQLRASVEQAEEAGV